MPRCFQYNNVFLSITDLTYHFKFIHKFDNNHNFRCRENNCFRDFNNIKSFRKHFQIKHVTENKLNSVEESNAININAATRDHFDTHDNETTSFATKEDNLEQFKNNIKSSALMFIANLYSCNTLPRNQVQTIINFTNELFNYNLVTYMKKIINDILGQNTILVDTAVFEDINSVIDLIKSPFEGLQSEFLCFKEFENSLHFIKPTCFNIGQKQHPKKSNDLVLYETIQVTGQFIELRVLFKRYFETSNILNSILNYIQELNHSETDIITNFIQASVWKNTLLKFSDETIVIPVFLYFDDYETGDALGSHAGVKKVGAAYVSFPCIPPKYRSSLENIFIALLFLSKDRKTFGNKKTFEKILDEFKFLETEGILVNTESVQKRVYFVLTLILGDNLGIHSIAGFTESFSSNFSCRFCKTSKQESQKACIPNNRLYRTIENYTNDVKTNDVSKTGIKEECIFNILPNFHIITNVSVDIMHDIFEGVLQYDMLHILKYYIMHANLFSVEILNHRMLVVNYRFDNANKPPILNADCLCKNKLALSASEMWCFVKYFAVIVGDIIPEKCEVWKFYIIIRNILDIITATYVTTSMIINLSHFVMEHNSLYISLFNDTLKPKHHHMLHYPMVMEAVGPLVYISSMRFEGKHRESKLTASITSSKINICKSLAIKHQLKLYSRFYHNRGFEDTMKFGPNDKITLSDITTKLPNIIIPETFSHGNVVKWIKTYNRYYSVNTVIHVNTKDLLPIFGVIKYVITKNTNIAFCYQLLETIGFSEHYHAYEVTLALESLAFIEISDLVSDVPVHYTKCADGNTYITLNHP